MIQGTLEVLLVGAKGLDGSDFLSKMDPYAVLICRTQEQRSSIASGAGSDPEWNETFVFTLTDHVSELTIKLMDSDSVSNDDYVGEAKIPLESLFMEGSLPPTVYNVVKDQEYHGEIKVGLTFTPTHGNVIIPIKDDTVRQYIPNTATENMQFLEGVNFQRAVVRMGAVKKKIMVDGENLPERDSGHILCLL